MLHDDIHINHFAKRLFGPPMAVIIRTDDPIYNDWTLACECGQRCRDVLLAAYNLYVMCPDADCRSSILRVAHEQCSVICYS